MNDNDLFSYAGISEDGSIRLGKYVVCDGYAHDVKAAVFTHPHVDHAKNSFEKCMHRYPVFMSHITTKLLEAINNDTYKIRTHTNSVPTAAFSLVSIPCTVLNFSIFSIVIFGYINYAIC